MNILDPPLLFMGPRLGTESLLEVPDTSNDLSLLNEASYAYQENWLWLLRIGGQEVSRPTEVRIFAGATKLSMSNVLTLAGDEFPRRPKSVP